MVKRQPTPKNGPCLLLSDLITLDLINTIKKLHICTKLLAWVAFQIEVVTYFFPKSHLSANS